MTSSAFHPVTSLSYNVAFCLVVVRHAY
jgi:hypothetical protein